MEILIRERRVFSRKLEKDNLGDLCKVRREKDLDLGNPEVEPRDDVSPLTPEPFNKGSLSHFSNPFVSKL